MNGISMSLCGQELRKGTIKIIQDEGGDSVLLSIGDDEEVTSSGGIPVVAPSRSWKYTWLRTLWSWCGVLSICRHVHLCNIELAATFIKNKGHVFDETLVMDLHLDWVSFDLNGRL